MFSELIEKSDIELNSSQEVILKAMFQRENLEMTGHHVLQQKEGTAVWLSHRRAYIVLVSVITVTSAASIKLGRGDTQGSICQMAYPAYV